MAKKVIADTTVKVSIDSSQLLKDKKLVDRQMKSLQRTFTQSVTPIERYEKKMKDLKNVYKAGRISTEKYARAEKQLAADRDRQIAAIKRQEAAQSKLNKTSKAGALTAGQGGAGGVLAGVGKKFIAGAAAYASVRGVYDAFRDRIETVDQLMKDSVKLGVSGKDADDRVNNLQAIQVSAETLANMDANATATALQRLARRAAEAAQGTGEAVKAFKELNIDAKKFSKLPIDEQFNTLSIAFEKVESAGDKTRLAMKFFDVEGVDLLHALEGGMDGVTAARARMLRAGLTVTKDEMKRQAEMKEGLDAFDDFVTHMKVSIGRLAAEAVRLAQSLNPKTAEERQRNSERFLDPNSSNADVIPGELDRARTFYSDLFTGQHSPQQTLNPNELYGRSLAAMFGIGKERSRSLELDLALMEARGVNLKSEDGVDELTRLRQGVKFSQPTPESTGATEKVIDNIIADLGKTARGGLDDFSANSLGEFSYLRDKFTADRDLAKKSYEALMKIAENTDQDPDNPDNRKHWRRQQVLNNRAERESLIEGLPKASPELLGELFGGKRANHLAANGWGGETYKKALDSIYHQADLDSSGYVGGGKYGEEEHRIFSRLWKELDERVEAGEFKDKLPRAIRERSESDQSHSTTQTTRVTNAIGDLSKKLGETFEAL